MRLSSLAAVVITPALLLATYLCVIAHQAETTARDETRDRTATSIAKLIQLTSYSQPYPWDAAVMVVEGPWPPAGDLDVRVFGDEDEHFVIVTHAEYDICYSMSSMDTAPSEC